MEDFLRPAPTEDHTEHSDTLDVSDILLVQGTRSFEAQTFVCVQSSKY